MGMRCVVCLIIIVLMHLQLVATAKASEEPSIFDLSSKITKTNGSVSLGSETITLIGQKRVALTREITLQHRYLLYEDKSDQRSSHNFHDILLWKKNEIVYKYEYGNNPDYRVIRLQKNENVLILLGGYSHDGDIEVFHVQGGTLTKTNSYKSEGEQFLDMDHDGIDEMLIADPHTYLLPEGALSDSVGLWVVLKYQNGFKYSPRLTREKYRRSLSIGNDKCDLKDRNSIGACSRVIEHILLNCFLGDFDSVAKAIRQNMLFHEKNDKTKFIEDFVDWFFDTQFIDEIKAYTGIQSPSEVTANLVKKTGGFGY